MAYLHGSKLLMWCCTARRKPDSHQRPLSSENQLLNQETRCWFPVRDVIGRWTTFVSSHWGRNISPRWKDVKVSSPQEHSDNRRGKTLRVKTSTWNRTLRCHSHLSSCNLGVALHFFFTLGLERVGTDVWVGRCGDCSAIDRMFVCLNLLVFSWAPRDLWAH